MGHLGATDEILDINFFISHALTPMRCWRGGIFQTDMHRHPNRNPGVAGRLGSREQEFPPLRRLWWVVLGLLASSGPCGGLKCLWDTVPGEWVGVLNSHSSSSGRKTLQNLANALLQPSLYHIQVRRTDVTSAYSLSSVSTMLHLSASPSCDPCLRGTCDRGDNYISLYMSSYSAPWSVWKLPLWCDSAPQNTLYFPKTSTVLVIIIAEVLSIFKCFSSSPNVEIDDLALSFYCQLLKRPVLD